ncbi:uncharacterized protein LOC143037108 [Oratosquilla oratoria]|uniref:uncharacterized protein LOC143037108 n=1 Tax=Oratosquilla oratoria TaxID=337810 RepID=UPI003F75AB16
MYLTCEIWLNLDPWLSGIASEPKDSGTNYEKLSIVSEFGGCRLKSTADITDIYCEHSRPTTEPWETPPVAVLFALVALAVARPDKLPTYSYSPPSQEDSHESLDIFETPKYEFTHAVKDEETANDFGHQEARDDEHTQGSYYVQLSDGRLQKVTYYVDGDSGFIAEVSYEGEARYPEPDSSEERFYAAPAPSPPQSLYGAPSK